MIVEDYCSQEIVKLLKAKGFPVGVGSWSRGFVWDGEGYAPGLVKHENSITHQMAMKWLREEHNIIIVIEPHSYNHVEEKASSCDFSIWCGDNYEHPLTTNYHTYEQAVEAALKYVLENLI